MSDNEKQNTLEDEIKEEEAKKSAETERCEVSQQPHSRRRRCIMDVPSRKTVGMDGEEVEEF